VHPATGKTENDQYPPLGLGTVFVSKDGSEDVSLTVGERRLNGLEDVRDVGLECSEWNLVQFDASRARFLQSCDHLSDTRNEEFGLDVSKHLENISTVAQLSMGIVQDAFGKDGLLADEGNPNSGTEAAVRHIIYSVH
jgi:hypothetical protein